MTTTQQLFKIALVNGAEVELFSFDMVLGYGHVLARHHNDWVTWRVYPSRRPEHFGKFEAEVGHYFRQEGKPAAYEDYRERTLYAC